MMNIVMMMKWMYIWWQGHHGDDGSDGVGGGLLPAGPDNHAATKVPGDKSDPRYPLTTGDGDLLISNRHLSLDIECDSLHHWICSTLLQ